MKCIKNSTTGNIIRVENQQANQMVGNTWKYVSKNEWKLQNNKKFEDVTTETSTGVTLTEKKKKNLKKVK